MRYKEVISIRTVILYLIKCLMIGLKINNIEIKTCYYIYNDNINYEEYLRSITT